MIDHTYLALKGWEAWLFSIEGQIAYVMSNPILNVIINQRGIIRNDSAFRMHLPDKQIDVSRVSYSDVWPYLIEATYKFDKDESTTVDIV